jgi:hypothetical protein
MTVIYAIETPPGTAGLAVRAASGFRFYAADGLFAALEDRRWPRLAEIHSAVNRLAASHNRCTAAGKERKTSPSALISLS